MGTKNNPGKFDCYEKAEPDEPMFVLLARDQFAPTLVWLWATLKALDNDQNPEKVQEARDCVAAMHIYQHQIGQISRGIGQAVLAGAMELIKAANYGVDRLREETEQTGTENQAMTLDEMRVFMAAMPFHGAPVPEIQKENIFGEDALVDGEEGSRAINWHDKYMRDVEGLNNEGDPIGGDPAFGMRQRLERAEKRNIALGIALRRLLGVDRVDNPHAREMVEAIRSNWITFPGDRRGFDVERDAMIYACDTALWSMRGASSDAAFSIGDHVASSFSKRLMLAVKLINLMRGALVGFVGETRPAALQALRLGWLERGDHAHLIDVQREAIIAGIDALLEECQAGDFSDVVENTGARAMRAYAGMPTIERLNAEHSQLRTALMAMIGEDDPERLRGMRALIEKSDEHSTPDPGAKSAGLLAIDALLEIRPLTPVD